MLLAGRTESTEVNGPGKRAGIWFQGCNLKCSGCWNEYTWSFDKAKDVPREEIIEWLSHLPEDLEGITLSGGEPTQQIIDTIAICKWINSNRPKWTIGMYTGYTYKELSYGNFKFYSSTTVGLTGPDLPGSPELWETLEDRIDFAIMGRYNKLLPSDGPLTTTANQELKFFSDRYTLADFQPQLVEITIGEDFTTITGFPVGSDLEDFY